MKLEYTKEQIESFREGRISAFDEIKVMCENKKISIKDSDAEKHTPRQLTNGGKILSLCHVINECKQRIKKSKDYRP
jgi:hypothetical protein